MADFVNVVHPDIAKPAAVTRDAFDLVYRAKGWVLVDGPEADSPPEPEPADIDPQPDPEPQPDPIPVPAPTQEN